MYYVTKVSTNTLLKTIHSYSQLHVRMIITTKQIVGKLTPAKRDQDHTFIFTF